MGDLTAGRVQAFLAELREQGRSIQTSNHYLRAIKQFSRWLLRERRIGEDPLAFISMMNVATDRRHDRRPLTQEESSQLLVATRRGRAICKIAADDRAMLYTIAAYTGLRAGELASLTTDSFRLDDSPPTGTVRAAYSKRRREDVLPLRAGLVEVVRPWIADREPGSVLWPGTWARYHFAGKMLQRDLKAAGIPYIDADGRFADFHALRHTFITNMVKGGVHPKMAQSLARHSTIELTMKVYTSLTVHDQAAALASLPAPPQLNADALQATGTDGPKMAPAQARKMVPAEVPKMVPPGVPGSAKKAANEPALAKTDCLKKVPAGVPRSAKMGANGLASAEDEIAPDCTQSRRRQCRARSPRTAINHDETETSGSSTQQSESSCEAERARFELAVPVRVLRFSRPVQSAALPPLRSLFCRRLAHPAAFPIQVRYNRFYNQPVP